MHKTVNTKKIELSNEETKELVNHNGSIQLTDFNKERTEQDNNHNQSSIALTNARPNNKKATIGLIVAGGIIIGLLILTEGLLYIFKNTSPSKNPLQQKPNNNNLNTTNVINSTNHTTPLSNYTNQSNTINQAKSIEEYQLILQTQLDSFVLVGITDPEKEMYNSKIYGESDEYFINSLEGYPDLGTALQYVQDSGLPEKVFVYYYKGCCEINEQNGQKAIVCSTDGYEPNYDVKVIACANKMQDLSKLDGNWLKGIEELTIPYSMQDLFFGFLSPNNLQITPSTILTGNQLCTLGESCFGLSENGENPTSILEKAKKKEIDQSKFHHKDQSDNSLILPLR